MVMRGMAVRSHGVPGRSGERVISAIHVAGDFVDLHGFVLTRLEHDIVALGPVTAEFIDHSDLREISENFPHLSRLFWLSTVIDAAMHRQWLVAAASLRSNAHLAHLLCEIYVRLASVGAAQDHRFVLPALQRELAEMLGYSPIHINRAVRDLRDRGLVRWTGAQVEILDWGELARLARFSPEYLDLDRFSR
ncbi:Crp/Fnr family transcriptional regulator [Paracoccus aminophilus]|nr:Crp/Fnr family transcriptional regulator [Paracoccus aminophilus]